MKSTISAFAMVRFPKVLGLLMAVVGFTLVTASTGRATERDNVIYMGQKIVIGAHFTAQDVEMVDYEWVGNSLHITMKWKGASGVFAPYMSKIRLDYTKRGGAIEKYGYSDNAIITSSHRGLQAAVGALNR